MWFHAMDGIIFNIQRYQIHDGAGIRTIVFLKGCPLRCLWCSNPESENIKPDLYYYQSKCKLCGKCLSACFKHANEIVDGNITINRDVCDGDGRCVDVCPHSARKIIGQRLSVEQIVKQLERDRPFYFRSGGGITIGGGELLCQPEFALEILKGCKNIGLHTAIETTGCGRWINIEKMLQHVDWIFYDLKLMNELEHKKYTGVSNDLILANAKKLSEALTDSQIHLVIRIPIVPGYTDSRDNIKGIATFVKEYMKSAKEVELLKYHNFGLGKYETLGKNYALADVTSPTEERMAEIKSWVEELGLKCKYSTLLSKT